MRSRPILVAPFAQVLGEPVERLGQFAGALGRLHHRHFEVGEAAADTVNRTGKRSLARPAQRPRHARPRPAAGGRMCDRVFDAEPGLEAHRQVLPQVYATVEIEEHESISLTRAGPQPKRNAYVLRCRHALRPTSYARHGAQDVPNVGQKPPGRRRPYGTASRARRTALQNLLTGPSPGPSAFRPLADSWPGRTG